MAPPSPRRSSRARATNSLSQQSSVNSGSSIRVERSTRSGNKTSSDKSTPSASLSSEPPDDLDEGHLLRRRKRGQDEDKDKTSRQDSLDMAHASDEIQEDDEAVRCICGFDDYPGPPPIDPDLKHTKDGQDAEVFAGIELTDDISGFFVQCDVCKVWQHGACVGIMTEESSPEEYFCEKCRKDLHKIHRASNGQRYSNYLPLNRPSRTTSRSASLVKETVRSPRIGSSKSERAAAAAAASTASKRRSTMNSREAAYDEDEQLRRAIEESKELATHQDDVPIRRTKRSRSDSEENAVSAKRQRTSSRSSSPAIEKAKTEQDDESDDATVTRNGSSKKSRSSRSHKEKSEREERERQRQEAAKSRKGRAERRRGDDSDPSEEMPLATRTSGSKPAEIQPSVEPPPASQVAPDTPPPGQAPVGGSHKKGAKGTQKKAKGRNQYTKDREIDNEPSPARSMSRDIARNDPEPNAGGGGGGGGGAGGTGGGSGGTSGNSRSNPSEKSSSKSKGASHSKVSMHEIKRRSAAFLEFIAKTQVEIANEDSEFKKDDETEKLVDPAEGQNGLPKIQINGDARAQAGAAVETAKDPPTKDAPAERNGNPQSSDFKDLSCFEMMDVLATDLVKWQNKHTAS